MGTGKGPAKDSKGDDSTLAQDPPFFTVAQWKGKDTAPKGGKKGKNKGKDKGGHKGKGKGKGKDQKGWPNFCFCRCRARLKLRRFNTFVLIGDSPVREKRWNKDHGVTNKHKTQDKNTNTNNPTPTTKRTPRSGRPGCMPIGCGRSGTSGALVVVLEAAGCGGRAKVCLARFILPHSVAAASSSLSSSACRALRRDSNWWIVSSPQK